MSFSGDVKAELCHCGLNRSCCALAESYGALLYANTFHGRDIKIITACPPFVRRLPRLWNRAFGFGFDGVEPAGSGKTALHIQEVSKISEIFARYGYDPDSLLSHHINLGVLEEDCCKAAFFRGAFLAGGSVTDPSKRCHLELVTDHKSVSGEAHSLLLEMGFTPGDTVRSGHYVLYLKQSDAIADFLTTIGAPGGAMAMMNAKAEKEMRNAINRRVNCDSANADKIVSAAQSQLERIRFLERETGLERLPEELGDLALLRIANPSASLTDLAALSSPPVSKSCINHRMRRLMSWTPENGT